MIEWSKWITTLLVLTGFFAAGIFLGHWTSDTNIDVVPIPANTPCIVISNLQHNQNLPNGDYCYTDTRDLPKGA